MLPSVQPINPAYNPISLSLHARRPPSQQPPFGAEMEKSFTDDDEGIEIAVRGENGHKRVAKQSKVVRSLD